MILEDSLVEVIRLTVHLNLLDDLLDFPIGEERTLYSERLYAGRCFIEHVSLSQKRFCSHLVKNDLTVYTGCDGKSDTRRDVVLDSTGNDLRTRTLGCKHQMDTDSTCHRGKATDIVLYILSDRTHKIRVLIHYKDDVWKLFGGKLLSLELVIESLYVPYIVAAYHLIAPVHLLCEPCKNLLNFLTVCDDRGEKMRNPIVYLELDNLRIDHYQAYIPRALIIKNRCDEAVYTDTLSATGASCDKKVRGFCNVDAYRLAGYRAAKNHRDRHLGVLLIGIERIEHVLKAYGCPLRVRNLNSDSLLSRNRSEYSYAPYPECVLQIIVACLDL